MKISSFALPSYPRNGSDLSTLKDLQIQLYVGANDGGWVTNAQSTYDALVELDHPNVILEIFPGEGDVFRPLIKIAELR
ncbi:hypothetical protein KFU94_03135 [Chloroflexi bacterium TSY]|nr:hypothetical protein [Chloroflexi bacterium TSY]